MRKDLVVTAALALSVGTLAFLGGCAKKADGISPTGSASASASASSASASLIPGAGMRQAPPGIPAPDDVAAAPGDALTTASGLQSMVLQPGTGKDHPAPTDKVKVNYTGWTAKDGKMFDSSLTRGQPATFGVTGVIPGWTEALQLMVVGEKRRLWIPGKLAYGDTPHMPGAPSGNLTFDVELLDILKPPPVPTDVAAAPPSAKKTASGLAYRVLTPSTDPNAKKPTATDKVTVNYSGWTTDGKMFDSSLTRGQPASFPLDKVIPGWTEGLQLMKVGDKTRFWIPGTLAYDAPGRPSRPGAPHGTLVFDVELLSIAPPGMPGMPPQMRQPPPQAQPTGGSSSR